MMLQSPSSFSRLTAFPKKGDIVKVGGSGKFAEVIEVDASKLSPICVRTLGSIAWYTQGCIEYPGLTSSQTESLRTEMASAWQDEVAGDRSATIAPTAVAGAHQKIVIHLDDVDHRKNVVNLDDVEVIARKSSQNVEDPTSDPTSKFRGAPPEPYNETKAQIRHSTGSFLEDRFSLSWSDLTFSVRTRSKGDKLILDGLYGFCDSGEMLALMGPSGGGKTTLLDLLGHRVSSGKIEGNILIGQRKPDAASCRKLISYVSQEDSLLSCFTVRETLRYAARLSLASLPRRQMEERIGAALEQMGLVACADTRVGDPLIKGISGGQKRRLSIATELLQASPLLLLDEPTSGLDSASALAVMERLRYVTDKGHTVLFSIHQPSSAIYDIFDSVCFLSGGRALYFGLAGNAVVKHFATLGHMCPKYTNPAEFVMSLANADFRSPLESAEAQVKLTKDLIEAFPKSNAGSKLRAAAKRPDSVDTLSYKGSHRAAGPVAQFFVLLRRILHMSWKNPYIFAVRLVMYTALAFMVGTMYSGVGETARGSDLSDPNVGKAAQTLLPLLYYVQAFLVFMSVSILPFFLEQKDVFRRERGNGQIECMPFVFANFLANLPGIGLIAITSTLLVVYLVDLNGFGAFFLNLFLSLVAAESLMHAIGAGQPHYIIGMAFGAGMFGMFMLCEGFMVPFSQIPAGWTWGHYIALHTYSFSWFVHNQFSGPDGGAMGPTILQNYDVEDVNSVKNACIIMGMAVLFEIVFFLVLKIVHTGRR